MSEEKSVGEELIELAAELESKLELSKRTGGDRDALRISLKRYRAMGYEGLEKTRPALKETEDPDEKALLKQAQRRLLAVIEALGKVETSDWNV